MFVAEDQPIAAFNLGVMFTAGYGTEPDDEKAVKWFTKAAHAGLEAAQYNLGVRFFWGDGVEQDYEKAYIWFHVARDSGYEQAEKALKTASFKLTPEAIYKAEFLSQNLLQSIREQDAVSH